MKTYILITVVIVTATAGLAACGGIVPFPRESKPHTLDHDDQASSSWSNSVQSSQLSVLNRRACHEKQQKNCS